MDTRCLTVFLDKAKALGFEIDVPIEQIEGLDYNKRNAVVLCKDGTVKTYSDANVFDTSAWTDVIQVACGRDHVVGLKKDGTVLASGSNLLGQCDVADLSDIQQIDCCNWTTLALRGDGTVACIGYSHATGTPFSSDNWKDIVKITCFDDGYLALKKDGTLYACDAMLTMAGHLNGGHLKVAQWDKVVDVCSGSRHCVAVREDGTLLVAYGDIPWARHEFGYISDATAAYCIGNYYAILHKDKTVSFHGEPLRKRSEKPIADVLNAVIQRRFPDILWGACPLEFSVFKGAFQTAVQFVVPSREKLTLDGYREAHYYAVQQQTYGYVEEFWLDLAYDLAVEGVDFYLCPLSVSSGAASGIQPYPGKWAATRAGLGWIGKNNLLITPEYGPRLTTLAILINDEVEYGTPIDENRCGECNACVDNCMFKVLKGQSWESATAKRDDFIDRHGCTGGRAKAEKTIGRRLACGKCIVSCPWGITKF